MQYIHWGHQFQIVQCTGIVLDIIRTIWSMCLFRFTLQMLLTEDFQPNLSICYVVVEFLGR